MTRDEILAMEAGRELDALVAEKVMGFAIMRENDMPVMRNSFYDPRLIGIGGQRLPPPLFSADIAPAWGVVEQLVGEDRAGPGLYFQMTHDWNEGYGTWATFDWKGVTDTHPLYTARADTAPLAICRAALLAVMEAD